MELYEKVNIFSTINKLTKDLSFNLVLSAVSKLTTGLPASVGQGFNLS